MIHLSDSEGILGAEESTSELKKERCIGAFLFLKEILVF